MPAVRPASAASVTARMGGVSMSTRSYSRDARAMSSSKCFDESSSEGLGGRSPMARKCRFSEVFRIASFSVAVPRMRSESPGIFSQPR